MLILLVLLVVNIAVAATCHTTIVGAGIGGLYSAFRLQNASVAPAHKICVFEATDRVGGRAHSIRGAFPMQASVDPGAHKYRPVEHPITDAIIKKILGLSTTCWYRTADCLETGRSYLDLRNYTKKMKKSKGMPYKLRLDEQWTDDEFPDPFMGLLVQNSPYIFDAIENLTSLDPSIRYPTLKNVLNQIRTTKVNGLYPNQMNLKTAINHSPEFWQLVVDEDGEAVSSILHVNTYDIQRQFLYYALPEFDLSYPEVITDQNGVEIGYSTAAEKLAQLLVSKGVNIYYNKEAVTVKQQPNGNMKVWFADGTSVTSDKVILNIPKKELMQLSHDSVIHAQATATIKNLYQLTTPVCAVKAYMYYPDAWWRTKLNIINGDLSTTRDNRYFEYTDSIVECINATHCKGYVNVAYADGQDWCVYFQTARHNKSNPIVIIHSNTSNLVEKQFFDDLTDQFMQSQHKVFQKAGIDPATLAKPERLVMGVWDEGWHTFPVSNFTGGEPSRLMLNPVPSVPVYVVNEAFSTDQGYAEGSLIAAEKVMKNHFGLNRLSWVGNQYWYDAIIANPNF